MPGPALTSLLLLLASPVLALAASTPSEGATFGLRSFWIAIILLIAGLFWIVEKRGQPAVLGELLAGVVLGNLGLLGLHALDAMKSDEVILFCSKLGVCILLFQIGLESNIAEMKRVGLRAFLVAGTGVVVTCALCGFLLGRWFLPEGSRHLMGFLFLGAVFAATSAGISARVLKDLGRLGTREAKIILGAAILDDVMSLLLLGVAAALVKSAQQGSPVKVTAVIWIAAKAILFLAIGIGGGRLVVSAAGTWLAGITREHKMKLVFALLFFLFYIYGAEMAGLDAIIGAFAAGLVLEGAHFREFRQPVLIEHLQKGDVSGASQVHLDRAAEHHITDMVASLGYIFVPIFFVMTGMLVDLRTLGNINVLGMAAIFLLAASVGKLACGVGAGRDSNFWVIGSAMIARGEVQLIAATMGVTLGVLTKDLFTAVVLVVISTTILVPLLLTSILKRVKTHAAV